MNPIQWERPVLIAAGLALALLAGGIWWSLQQADEARLAERRLRLQQTQWSALAASEPAPVAAVAAELSRRVEAAESRVSDLQRRLGSNHDDPVAKAEIPATRADAFFAIAQYMDRQRAAAETVDVRLADRESFGFSAHRNSGPADGHRAWVHRQLVIADEVLSALWRCRPDEFLRLQRENPVVRQPAGGTGSVAREGDPADWVMWPKERSLRQAGLVDSFALRVSWVGRTATLRAWLRQLRELPMPLLVREVAVEPLESGRPAGGRRSLADLFRDEGEPLLAGETDTGGPVPLIADNAAVFTVTLEYLDFNLPAGANPTTEDVW